ncbi:MAG: TolC family protein [Chitinophagaceae bacterium]
MNRFIIFCLCLLAGINSWGQKNTLDYFLEQAVTNSPLLKDYQGQLLSFSLDSQIIRAALRPQVNGISINSYAPVIHGYGYDEAITNGAQLSALIQVSKDLQSNKTIASKIRDLQIQGKSITNTSKISQQDLRKAIADQYIITYGEQLQLDFNTHITDLLVGEDSLLRKLTRDNVYKQTDYLSFTVTLQQQLLTNAQLNIQYVTDYLQLNYLAGIMDTLTPALQEPFLSISSMTSDFTNTIFYQQYVLDSLKLVNDRSLIDLTYRPKFNLFADAGYNSSLAYLPYKNFGTSVGVNLTIPIYDGRQKKLQYSKIDIQERTRLTKRDFFLQQHQQQIMQLMKQLKATEQLISQVNKQIRYTEALITASEKLLATGDIRLTDFILTLNNYFTAKNLLAENYVSRLKILNQLNYWDR